MPQENLEPICPANDLDSITIRLNTAKAEFAEKLKELQKIPLTSASLSEVDDEVSQLQVQSKKHILALAISLHARLIAEEKLIRKNEHATLTGKNNIKLENLANIHDTAKNFTTDCLNDNWSPVTSQKFAELTQQQPRQHLRNAMFGIIGAGLVALGAAVILAGLAIGFSTPISAPVGGLVLAAGSFLSKLGIGCLGTCLASAAISLPSMVGGGMLFAQAFKPKNIREHMNLMRDKEYYIPKIN